MERVSGTATTGSATLSASRSEVAVVKNVVAANGNLLALLQTRPPGHWRGPIQLFSLAVDCAAKAVGGRNYDVQ